MKSLAGVWYDPNNEGFGVFVNLNAQGQPFGAFFGYNLSGQQCWLILLPGNAPNTLDVYRPLATGFLPISSYATGPVVGRVQLIAHEDALEFAYAIDSAVLADPGFSPAPPPQFADTIFLRRLMA